MTHYQNVYAVVLSSLTLSTPVVAATVAYPVVDTHQTQCYNASATTPCPASDAAFYGQDAQSTGHTPRYALSANGATVSDNVTGLTWQYSPETNGDNALTKADKLTYANAVAHCAAQGAANHQGFNDWRLPTIKELYSLIDFRGVDPSGYSGSDTSTLIPFIDTDYFNFAYGDTSAGERIIDSQYASSTVYVVNPGETGSTKLFGVNFADGRIKGYDLTMPGGAAEKTFFVQCVRGNPAYGINAFIDNSDQTITDQATGLMWTKFDSGVAMNWQSALTWAQAQNSANYLGYHDWRLPNAKELHSILDYRRSPSATQSAAIDPVFNATTITNEGGQTDWPWYWASTTHTASNGMGAAAVYLAFGRATGWQKATPTATCYTLYDVHGAGAQRSDPKTSSGVVTIGLACNGGTAYGLGPQGDVQRAANFVRLVRDSAPMVDPATTLITHYYTSILGRDPDAAGLAYWQQQIAQSQAQGLDVKSVFREIAGDFFNSPEYLANNTSNTQFITNLYRTFLQRDPDPEGIAFWLNQLVQGVSRNTVISGFLYSIEFTTFMESLGF